MQELRDEGALYFLGDGNYLLALSPITVEEEDLPADALDIAVAHNNLRFGLLPASDRPAAARRRVGQQKIRQQTLINYGFRCALCDIQDTQFLVAGHILRWADSAESRGDLRNLICMCRIHDALFEQGYFSLADDYQLICKPNPSSQMISAVFRYTQPFRLPGQFPHQSTICACTARVPLWALLVPLNQSQGVASEFSATKRGISEIASDALAARAPSGYNSVAQIADQKKERTHVLSSRRIRPPSHRHAAYGRVPDG